MNEARRRRAERPIPGLLLPHFTRYDCWAERPVRWRCRRCKALLIPDVARAKRHLARHMSAYIKERETTRRTDC